MYVFELGRLAFTNLKFFLTNYVETTERPSWEPIFVEKLLDVHSILLVCEHKLV